MRIDQVMDNGNVQEINRQEHLSHRQINNRNWKYSNNHTENIYHSETAQNNVNSNYKHENSDVYLKNNIAISKPVEEEVTPTINLVIKQVYNKQYRINTQNNLINLKTYNTNDSQILERSIVTPDTPSEKLIRETNVYSISSFGEEEKPFEQSDADEMSENGVQSLPRGIVNPNYPGFQHLAHTLQDYSSNIDNFYHSENDMTDDDVDVEITELSYDCEAYHNGTTIENKNIKNNNNNNEQLLQTDLYSNTKQLDSHVNNEVPDLIKTVSKNNNNVDVTVDCEFNCSDTDIENNFNTKDIIGDFNKEIEDEIRQLLNYNINIQDDLEELRKDIKDSFAKPIESTINNISDVVNHVIKKLVETQNDGNEPSEKDFITSECDDDIAVINRDNETNTKTEMNLSRPTFLLIENNTHTKIIDAHLSDGKDEINIYENEYDTDKLTSDVDTTIKQLSTELRKIIPKLDEMRERDKLWAINNTDPITDVTDGNSNKVSTTSNCAVLVGCRENQLEFSENDTTLLPESVRKPRQKSETRTPKNRHKETNSSRDPARTAQNTSVQKTIAKDSDLECFDVYNIETALPKLDLDAIENHLRAAKEAERRKRNDREEIRRRLAMGADNDEYYSMGHTDRPGKKPSLHSRLQNGMNLQICFMNETASDNESLASDIEKNYNSRSSSRSSVFSKSSYNHPYQTRPLSVNITKQDKINSIQNGAKLRPTSLSVKSKSRSSHSLGHIELKESDFYALQATLQTEARIALAQAKEMARIQMERERRSRPVSPVTEMLRRSMEKASAPLAPDRRRVSRQLLTDMNIAQLQVIVNELHSQIESLNDSLVKLLMARDELHMGQDSMLVDIEDLTRYLGVKEQTKKTKGTTKSGVRRFTSLVHK
ncbi:hypothetical protein evm_010204 [Chilo suppressalis]|nr:hypothetical protein evm_010204 [Chilo suppressalis]